VPAARRVTFVSVADFPQLVLEMAQLGLEAIAGRLQNLGRLEQQLELEVVVVDAVEQFLRNFQTHAGEAPSPLPALKSQSVNGV
jgi:hypothetical protein